MNKRKIVPYREDEPELEFIEDIDIHPEFWGTEVDKKLMTISAETRDKLLEVENKGVIVDVNPKELRLSLLNPRQKICESKELRELRLNISVNKRVTEPLTVRFNHGVPEVVKGGLRWRIAVLLDLPTVPVLVKTLSDMGAIPEIISSEIKVETDPISRAEWFAYLMRLFHCTQRELVPIAKVSRETVSNYLTLLRLPSITKESIRAGKMSFLVALDILKELNETYYGKTPMHEIVSYTKKYLELKKDKRKRLSREEFRKWMRTKRQLDATRKLAEDYGIPEEKRFEGKPYKSKVEKEIEGMDKERDKIYDEMPPNIAEKKAKVLLESAPEELQKRYEGKVFGKDYSFPKLMHDIRVAEGNEPKLETVVLERKFFQTEEEADDFFKLFRGRLLKKEEYWIGEVDMFLYKCKECKWEKVDGKWNVEYCEEHDREFYVRTEHENNQEEERDS